MNKVIYWIRWISVLPGALIGGFLTTFPLHWILLIVLGHEDSLLFGFIEFPEGINIDSIEYFIYPAVIATFYIVIGAMIAPVKKFKTAVCLFFIYFVVWISISIFALLYGEKNGFEFSFRTVFALLGALLGLLEVKQSISKTKNENQA